MALRCALPVAAELLQHFPGLITEGARQVGKSTLAMQLAGERAVVATLDDEQTRSAAAADAAGFVAQAGSEVMVIDEIQKMPELTLAVKAAIDRDRRPGRFTLTGSSSLLRVRQSSQTRHVWPAPRRPGHERNTPQCSPQARIPKCATPRVRDAWLDAYLQGIIGRDMSELRKGVEPARVSAVLRTLAGGQSAELVKAKLAKETSVPPRTITGYLDLVHDVGLVATLPPWTPNLAKREIGRTKTFVIDSGLAMWLARMTLDQLTRLEYGEGFGAFLEAFVVAELLRQRAWSGQRYDVFHWRDRDGKEVDIVLELGDGRVLAIDVKSATSFNAKQFKGLTRLRDELGPKFIAGIVLNTTDTG